MKIKDLRATHPTYNATRWSDLTALAKGGHVFRDKLSRFLPQNTVEPIEVYRQRLGQAHYTSYMGPIINLYVSWLFAADFDVRPSEEGVAIPEYYGQFQERVAGECTLKNFMRERFREALTVGKSYWIVELPSNEGKPAESQKEFEDRGLGCASLCKIEVDNVIDWECDEDGCFKWVMVKTVEKVRESVYSERDTIIETYRHYDDVNVTTWVLRYKESKPPSPTSQAPLPNVAPHGFKRVPIVKMELPIEICVGEQTHDPQLEHFRIDNALSWLIRRTCYAQPVFYLENPDDSIPKLGAGYAMVLGHEDKQGWTSPPSTPFDILQKNVEAKRDEIYRVTHQMAQAVDNNAETVGRSADSKEIDAAATRIMLNAYGEYVSAALEETYEIISEGRNEVYEWSVTGFSGYDVATVSSLIADATAAKKLGVPSPLFHKTMSQKVVSAILAGEDPILKGRIKEEIETAEFESTSTLVEETLADKQIEAEKQAAELAAKTQVAVAKMRPKPKPGASGAKSK